MYKPLEGIAPIFMAPQDMGMGMLNYMVSLANKYGRLVSHTLDRLSDEGSSQ